MGSDGFQNLHKWKNYEVIIKKCPIYIYPRPGFEVTDTLNANVTIVDAPLLQISSTQVREMIRQGKSVRYLLPPSVLEEIEKSGYYRK